MNEQDLFLKVGELATRTGYPMPSIRMVDAPRQNFVRLKPQGSVGPVLELRPEIWGMPAGRLEFFIAQDFVALVLGIRKYRLWQQVLTGLAAFVGIVLLGDQLGILVGLAVLLLVGFPLMTVVSALWWRVVQRRVDRRLSEVLGRDQLEAALQELVDVGHWHRGLRWFWCGALPLPPERLGWLRRGV